LYGIVLHHLRLFTFPDCIPATTVLISASNISDGIPPTPDWHGSQGGKFCKNFSVFSHMTMSETEIKNF